jgi:hypothetical protein
VDQRQLRGQDRTTRREYLSGLVKCLVLGSGETEEFLVTPGHCEVEALNAKRSMFDVLDRGLVFVCDTNGPGEH